ncbi:MAG: hypothetical protein WBR18_11135 [Anaerolineales bacterium]
MRAGHAWALAGKSAAAAGSFVVGPSTLASAGQATRARVLAAEAVEVQEEQGMLAPAEDLRQQLPDLFREADRSASTPLNPGLFPAKCPYCGANLAASTLERRAGGSPTCAYCGSRVGAA